MRILFVRMGSRRDVERNGIRSTFLRPNDDSFGARAYQDYVEGLEAGGSTQSLPIHISYPEKWGTILRPPSVMALYTQDHGRFNLNLFVKNRDGTIESESTIGRYTFSATKYCEWIVYTTRNNLDRPGVTNEVPAVTDHCIPVTSKNGRFNFSPPGEGVDVSFGPEGFTAQIGTEFVDHWRKIR